MSQVSLSGMEEGMHKLGVLVGGEWTEHIHDPMFEITDRLVAGAPKGDPTIFEQLVARLEPPYLLLYVLHTPRGGAEPGRYQGPGISRDDLHAFVERFSDFLRADARFDLWAHSPQENATVVWDRHNQIYGYGPLQKYAEVLDSKGFRSGPVERVSAVAHTHNYWPVFDAQAQELMGFLPWSRSPLRQEDEQ